MREALRLARSWEFAPVPWLLLLTSGALYILGAARVTRVSRAHPWPLTHTWCFVSGLVVSAVAVVGPPGVWDDVFFYAHMTQHILLTLVAAPLLVLGDPVLLVLRASGHRSRGRLWVPLVRSRSARALAHPAFGWVLFVGVMVVTHLPLVYDGFLRHPLLHDYVEHPLYLISAMVYFQPLLRSSGTWYVPHWIRLLSLFTVMIPMAMIGFVIFATPGLAYPFYAHVARPFGPAPVADQHMAGILMWSTSMVLSVAWLVLAGRNWLNAEERRTARAQRGPHLTAGTSA